MTRPLPTAPLVLPAEGDRTTHNVMRRVWLLAMRALLEQPSSGLSGDLVRDLDAARTALVRATKRAPEQTLAAIASPDVLTPVLSMLGRQVSPQAALSVAIPNLLTELSRTAAADVFSAPVRWSTPVDCLADCRQGRAAVFTQPATGLVFTNDSVRREAGDEPVVWTAPYSPIDDALPLAHLATVDTNPLRTIEAHPDKDGNAVDLGGKSPEAWCAGIRRAIELVGEALPALLAELAVSLDRVVPVGWDDDKHLSASYREAPGLVYMTLHPNPVTMAEAIVHETQHGKLNAMTWFDPVLNNAHSQWTESPVRPDLRPLFGVLLAAHAFVPVAAMHMRLADMGHSVCADPWFHRRRREVVETNDKSMNTVAKIGDFTPRGRVLMNGLEALHAVTRDAL